MRLHSYISKLVLERQDIVERFLTKKETLLIFLAMHDECRKTSTYPHHEAKFMCHMFASLCQKGV